MSKATRPTTRFCPGCSGTIAAGLPMCGPCVRQVQREVRESHDLLSELDVELSRQGRKGDSAGRRSTETPLAYDLRASVSITELRASIRALASAAPNIATHHIDRMRDARKDALRTIDRARTLRLIGVCPCSEQPLYASPDETEVQCRKCHEEYPVGQVAAWEHLERVIATLSDCRAHMTVYGLRRSKSALQRDLVAAHRTARQTDPDTERFAPVYEQAGVTFWRLTDCIEAAWAAGCRPADPQHLGPNRDFSTAV